jgi:bis(5'-nucleosyl)-tetraphosphatase (symmetrical)
VTLAFGDVQGCAAPLERLLQRIAPTAQEPLWFCGDLVNRGPRSLRALQRVQAFGDRARVVLGNHDLHLLAVASGRKPLRPGDTLAPILAHPQARDLIGWLRRRPLAVLDGDFLMVHAGLDPRWDGIQAVALAREVERRLAGPDWGDFLEVLYGNEPAAWDDALTGDDRLRVIVNILTRLRFMWPDGRLDLKAKGHPESAPADRVPWYDMPNRRTANRTVIFGHWSTLGLLRRPGLIGLDTGCVWGGTLSAVRLESGELFQEPCPQAAEPGQD